MMSVIPQKNVIDILMDKIPRLGVQKLVSQSGLGCDNLRDLLGYAYMAAAQRWGTDAQTEQAKWGQCDGGGRSILPIGREAIIKLSCWTGTVGSVRAILLWLLCVNISHSPWRSMATFRNVGWSFYFIDQAKIFLFCHHFSQNLVASTPDSCWHNTQYTAGNRCG